jgi:hypothetical protein
MRPLAVGAAVRSDRFDPIPAIHALLLAADTCRPFM